MSDSDSDSDLIREVYDPEDNLNVYGSPVLRSAATEEPSTSSALTRALPERTQVSVCLLSKFTTTITICCHCCLINNTGLFSQSCAFFTYSIVGVKTLAVKKLGERRGAVHAETKVYFAAPCVAVEILKRPVGIKRTLPTNKQFPTQD